MAADVAEAVPFVTVSVSPFSTGWGAAWLASSAAVGGTMGRGGLSCMGGNVASTAGGVGTGAACPPTSGAAWAGW